MHDGLVLPGGANDPPGHTLHASVGGSEPAVPAGQITHEPSFGLLGGLKWPAWQAVQLSPGGWNPKVPPAQGLHNSARSGANVPSGQRAQDGASGWGAARPTAQSAQPFSTIQSHVVFWEVEPWPSEKRPARQPVHEPSAEVEPKLAASLPAPHVVTVQTDSPPPPPGEKEPGGQFSHSGTGWPGSDGGG
jgi:hypothetical protein